MSTKIFRFLSFESFVDTVLRNELVFVTYDLWQDPYEGFVIKALQTEKGLEEIKDWLIKNTNPEDIDIRLFLLQTFSKTMHLQSWTKCEESDALWRIYSHNGSAVRIETSIKNVLSLDKVKYFKVDYQNVNLKRELASIFKKEKLEMHHVFTFKRSAFKHEEEVRLFTEIDNRYLQPSKKSNEAQLLIKESLEKFKEIGAISTQEYENGLRNIELPTVSNSKIKQISFSHIPNFIESVVVHPIAADWFVETVKLFCERNDIKFKGKSTLYKFNHKQ